jgi:hypothetical protein
MPLPWQPPRRPVGLSFWPPCMPHAPKASANCVWTASTRTTDDSPWPDGRVCPVDGRQPALVWRHHLRQDQGWLGVPGHRHRPAFPRRGGLGDHRSRHGADSPRACGCHFHSDRGTRYTSHEFAQYCTENGGRRSLGKTGICYENAVSNHFFSRTRKSLIHTRPWPTVKRLAKETFDWIETYYNTHRRVHSRVWLTSRFVVGLM